jgi:glycosyltransferase involved in cell wall biosynthesis
VRLLAMAKELQRRGHEIDVVTAMPNYPRGEIFPAYKGRLVAHEVVDGLSVTRTWIYPATGANVLKRLLNYGSFTLSALWGCLRAPRPDYIFVESPPLFLGVTAWLASALRRSAYIFNVSDLWPESAASLGIVTNRTLISLAERLERFCYRHAFRVCAVTEGIRETIAAVPGAAPVLLLPNGVDLETFCRVEPARIQGVSDSAAAFVFAGTHGYAQGLDVIVEAARLLTRRSDIQFVLVGDGPDKPRLQALARELLNVSFLDPVPVTAMPEIFSAARASIVPLRKLELFKGARPSKILPCLACETAVIYAGEGETAELIEANQCGLVVPPECAQKLAEAVVRLADEPALARRLGQQGRRLVTERYGWENIVGRWLAEMRVP